MEPIDVYMMYCAMKAHFGKGNYDFIDYKGKTKITRKSFYKRKDRYFFAKLSRKYDTEKEVKNYFIWLSDNSFFSKLNLGFNNYEPKQNYKKTSFLLERIIKKVVNE